ncbi:cadherin-like beta sandwich domain-containing protein [Luteolibacter sp. Populi]|uniref:cadherin-like beta sandwich domain-containing protein n=1 Tax=Luteolibacter sp. Populi TaxID=3230487 RepID=UPI003465F858
MLHPRIARLIAIPAAVWAALLLTLMPAAAVEPVQFTWTDAVDGNWSDATKWTDDQAAGTTPAAAGFAGYTLDFAVAGPYTATQDLNAGFQLNLLRFGESELTLAGNGIQFIANGATLPEIQQNGAVAVTLGTPVELASDLAFGGTSFGTVTLTAGISGNGGLTKNGAGILSLGGTVTYSGNTTVNNGTLRLSGDNAANNASTLTVAEGATLELDFGGSDTVLSLVLGGVAQPNGVYDAVSSPSFISGTGSITVFAPPPPVPSANANLSGLAISGASLSPAFNTLTGTYSTTVANNVASVSVTPTTAVASATVKVNGVTVASGVASGPISLNVGSNLITTVITAENGTSTRIYTVGVTRAAPVTVASVPAVVIDSARATLNGTVNPNGVATVYFEYGLTPAYGSRTPDRDISGNLSRPFVASLNGLSGATTYHFRAVVVSPAGTTYGNDLKFTTPPNPPVAATGAPASVTASSATLIGAVNPNGVKASAYFEYGLTAAYGQATPVQNVAAGFAIVGVQVPNLALIPGATYHYRLVASNAAGTALGEDVVFTVQVGGGGGSGVPTSAPEVVTESAVGIGAESAILRGMVNPKDGTTLVQFEYGIDTTYGQSTALQGIGNGDDAVDVAFTVQGLLPGTTYHYRVSGSNNLGKTNGEDAFFTTDFPAPTAVTGASTVLTTTSVKLDGTIRARGAAAEAWIEYGTDGVTFNSVRAVPADVSGDLNTEVSAEVPELAQGVTYFFRVRALGPQGEGVGESKTFDVESLSGLIRQFPPGVAAADRQGSVNVTISPADIGSGWRFAGEQFWRESGVPATGLTSGDRVIEYRPVPGFIQPANEAVAVISSPAATALARTYVPTGSPGSGSLTVFLKPQDLTEGIAPARWRFFGESEAEWKESGTTISGLVPGNHVILSKDVDGRATPHPVTATITDSQTATVTITYYIKEDPVGEPPALLAFEAVSSDENLPNAYVGQLRGDAGSGSGFVVRPGVVATAGHVIFDDGTLAATTGLQWLFQRDRDVHDPVPQTPRGFYLMTGYAAQRAEDNSPGVSTPASQTLDAGTLFFLEPAGRGGFSGYLASDSSNNEFLLSEALKTFTGYPVDGVAAVDLDRMHATPPSAASFTKSFGRTYITSDIRGSGGASGGPLCVLSDSGAYYPAAIYLGGTGQTVVRALDSDMVTLIGFADVSSGAGVGAAGGSLSPPETSEYPDELLGGLKVIIEPAPARAAGAGWRINSQSPYQLSGDQLDALDPNIYSVTFPTLEGFVPPAAQSVTVAAAGLTTVTFTYEDVFLAPAITSPGTVAGVRGQALSYQITADHSPTLYSLRGALPAGVGFNPLSGLISGTPTVAGVFPVTIGASNSGGADSQELVITALPVMEAQAVTVPYLVPMSYQVVSSETGAAWTGSGFPEGISINPATGLVSGIPGAPGSYDVLLAVSIRGASVQAPLTIVVTGIPPQFTLQPAAARSIQYRTSTTFVVAAGGLPEPTFQWYEGESGDTSAPVSGATATTFTTPLLTGNASYWVRASSLSGTADSNPSLIFILPSANANLTGIFSSDGQVSPSFNPDTTLYTLAVANEVSAVLLTPLAEVVQSTVRVAGVIVPTDAASNPINLAVGSNAVHIDVTSGDGSTTKRYTVTITRTPPASIVTGVANGITFTAATLRGAANPNGKGTVFFQYGTTTAYGSATPGEEITGSSTQSIAAVVEGLSAETTYHYRIGITTGAGTIFGLDKVLITTKAPPLVATGQASDVEDTKVKLIGAVDTNGTATTVRFEWGDSTSYGNFTPQQVVPGGPNVVDIAYTLEGLVPNTIYHYRLVGTSTAGNAVGEDVVFIASSANGGTGTPVAVPEATTVAVHDVSATSAVLEGLANPMGGTTFVRFEYGTTLAYGSSTPAKGIGSGSDPAPVVVHATGLIPGRTYHCRLVASNSLGTTRGEDLTFETSFLAPLATTGGASPLNSTSVRLAGSVLPRGAAAEVFFEYGTDGVSFPNRIAASTPAVSGETEVPVHVDLANLTPGVAYFYRTFAVRPADPTSSSTGAIKKVQSDGLVGLLQQFPRELDVTERQGSLLVNTIPAGIGSWRFVGEIHWRASGSIATGMTTGDREIEFLPIAGYHQPGRELVGIISGAPGLVLEREYFVSATPPDCGLQVFLLPENRTGVGVPLSSRVQWRPFGYVGLPWRNSGEVITGLTAGSYLVEFKTALDLDAPPPSTLVIAAGETRVATFTYNPDLDANAGNIRVLPYDTVSTRRNQPYAYVGQIRNDTGSHSGFAVKPRVVATTAQAVFDEITLAQVPGVQWLFQQDRDVHEPKPQVPRGFYVFDGYAAQREAENTPGELSIAAQESNVAALYFLEDAGRGGYSGFLSTDDTTKPLLSPTALKTLVGYPVRGGGSTSNHGRMQASRSDDDAYTQVSPSIFGTNDGDIFGVHGMLGGPLCVQVAGGNYFPAGIYLGGHNEQNLVRAIDSVVIDLFNRAELTANTGNNNNSGGISQTSYSAVSTTSTKGSLTVVILPLEARLAGALWKPGADSSFLISGTRKNNLTPGEYILQLKAIPGFQAPAQQTVGVLANNLTTVTFTYLPELSPLFSWRQEHFASTSNTGSAADGADPDGDGSLNLDEYIAGTDPMDPRDVFAASEPQRTDSTFSLMVPAKSGRIYTLQRRISLESENWSDVTVVGPILLNGPLTLTDFAATAAKGFYRVRVESLVP